MDRRPPRASRRRTACGRRTCAKGPRTRQKPDEKSLLFVKKVEGRPAAQVVADLLPGLLRALAFPKRMSWDAWLDDGKGAFPFGRPIRWMVALLDGTVVPFTIYELVAGAKGKAIVAERPHDPGPPLRAPGLVARRRSGWAASPTWSGSSARPS